jgi:hypothetical protein
MSEFVHALPSLCPHCLCRACSGGGGPVAASGAVSGRRHRLQQPLGPAPQKAPRNRKQNKTNKQLQTRVCMLMDLNKQTIAKSVFMLIDLNKQNKRKEKHTF